MNRCKSNLRKPERLFRAPGTKVGAIGEIEQRFSKRNLQKSRQLYGRTIVTAKADYGEDVVKKTRRSEKIVEIHEFYAIRTASGSLPALCAECSSGDAIMLVPDHAALLSHVPTRMIYRLVENGSIHYREEPNGSLHVCVRTLVAARNQVTGIEDNNN